MTSESIDKKQLDASDIFECRMCGECCTGYGGTYVTEKDINAIAEYKNIDIEQFKKKYCSLSGGKPLLATGSDGKCIFFDKLCTIHPVKPRMCREWPFIPGVVRNPGNWDLMASACAGIKTGVSHSDIVNCTKQQLAITRPEEM